MEKQFRVAFLGINPSNDHEDWVYKQEVAIRTYDLNVDQILEIVENAGPKGLNDQSMSLSPLQQCGVMTGGRGAGFPDPKVIRQMMKEIEVLIISAGTYYIYEAQTLLSTMTAEDCLSHTCTIVLRMPFEVELKGFKMKSSEWLAELGLDTKTKKQALRKKKRQQINGRSTVIIGHTFYDATDPAYGLPELRSILTRVELTEAVTKPLQETVSAGKSLLDVGQRFGGWMRRLFSAN